jgi:hypothetical protein
MPHAAPLPEQRRLPLVALITEPLRCAPASPRSCPGVDTPPGAVTSPVHHQAPLLHCLFIASDRSPLKSQHITPSPSQRPGPRRRAGVCGRERAHRNGAGAGVLGVTRHLGLGDGGRHDRLNPLPAGLLAATDTARHCTQRLAPVQQRRVGQGQSLCQEIPAAVAVGASSESLDSTAKHAPA